MQTQDIKDTFEVYKSKMEHKLSDLDTEIQSLKVKALETHAEQKQKSQQMLEELELKRENLMSQLNEFEQKGSSAYEEMKDGFENAWSDLSLAFDKAKASV